MRESANVRYGSNSNGSLRSEFDPTVGNSPNWTLNDRVHKRFDGKWLVPEHLLTWCLSSCNQSNHDGTDLEREHRELSAECYRMRRHQGRPFLCTNHKL